MASDNLIAETFTVVNTNPTGPGSLLQAVLDANPQEGTVVFAIPGPGVHKIDLSNTVIPVGYNVTIDGYTQPGARPNTLNVGDNAVILIQLDGGGPTVTSNGQLSIYGDDAVIRGLSLTGFLGPNAAIYFSGPFLESNRRIRIEGNFIGLEADGVTLRGNDTGIYTHLGTLTTIGGTTPEARNIISGNGTGVFMDSGFQTITGNYFGTDASGIGQGYGNDVAIFGVVETIGGAEPGAGNVITNNKIGIYAGASFIIRGNLIGPRADASPSIGNGIGIVSYGGNTIGGLGPGEGNVIAFNDTGVLVGGDSDSILSNLFYGNSFMDIDLGGDGPTPNHSGAQNSGPNHWQNFPILLSSTRNPGETIVSGGLNSRGATAFTLQFFANGPASAPNQRLLGTRKVTTNSAGDVSFQLAFPVATSPDEFLTATATDPSGNTSEFFPSNGTAELANISTRANVETGDGLLIGGLLLNSGTIERNFLVRALGPSLNINGSLADPQVDVRTSDGTLVGHNDNWRDSQQQEIFATGLAPSNDNEAAILLPLPGESYTVQVSGVNGTTGVATVEIYALESASGDVKEFRNLSTRGSVGTGDNVLIGGTILLGSAAQRLVARAIGPDLAGFGVPGALPDPSLELRDAEGALLASNDDWRSDQEQELIVTGLAPQDDRDSAILITLVPTSYTAIVRGKNGISGVALVEIYKLP